MPAALVPAFYEGKEREIQNNRNKIIISSKKKILSVYICNDALVSV